MGGERGQKREKEKAADFGYGFSLLIGNNPKRSQLVLSDRVNLAQTTGGFGRNSERKRTWPFPSVPKFEPQSVCQFARLFLLYIYSVAIFKSE